MFSYQIVGIVHYDLTDGGTARVRQVGAGMTDRQSTETCERREEEVSAIT